MRGGKGIRNSKFEMRNLEEKAHAKPANILLTQRPPRPQRTESPDAGRGANAGLRKNFMNMNQIYKTLFILCLSFSSCLAGDLVLDEHREYSGMQIGCVRASKTGAYEGCVFRNGNLTDRYGAYAGRIMDNGTILDSWGRYSGTASSWADRDAE